MPSAHDILEYETNEEPRREVDTAGWRKGVGTIEEDREVNVAEERAGVAASGVVEWERKEETNEEEPEKWRIELADGEESLRTDSSPKKRCIVEGSRRRANEEVLLIGCAQSLDVGNHPVLHAENNKATHDGSQHLRPEHGPWRDLHVVAKLQIDRERVSLSCSEVTVGLEDHHGGWPTRKCITDNELGQDVESDGLIGNGLNNTSWDDVNDCDEERKEKSPDWQLQDNQHPREHLAK